MMYPCRYMYIYINRKSLCIHPDVMSLASETAMNDACLDMIQSSTAASSKKIKTKTKNRSKAGGCPFKKKTSQRYFRQHALVYIDIYR